jgi:hypothetical protein
VTSQPFNLATRPFHNVRLPALLLAAGWLALLLGCVFHALAIKDLLPAETNALHNEVAALEQRRDKLEQRALGFQRDVPPAALKEWVFVKGLVDRRAFSWTQLLQDLEQALPNGARIDSLSHDQKDEQLTLLLEARFKDPEEGLELVRRLEARPEFEQVYPVGTGRSQDGEAQLRCRMLYLPQPLELAPAKRPRSGAQAQNVVARADEELQ